MHSALANTRPRHLRSGRKHPEYAERLGELSSEPRLRRLRPYRNLAGIDHGS